MSPSLPLTVTRCDNIGSGLYRVEVALFDGSMVRFVIPETLATIEAVSISAMALATLLERDVPFVSGGGNVNAPHAMQLPE